MRHTPLMLLAVVGLMAFASDARAQNFFGGNNTAFAPQISIVSSGAVLDAQPVVSADRKYVTMNMRPSLSTLVALRDFAFQTGGGPGGTVGMNGNGGLVNGNGGAVGNAGAAASSGTHNSANNSKKILLPALAKPVGPTPVLMQEGMHRVDQTAK